MKNESPFFKVKLVTQDDKTIKEFQIHENYSNALLLGAIELLKLKFVNDNKQQNKVEDILIDKWAEELRKEDKISTRLYNFLTNPQYFSKVYLNELDKFNFIKYRGCGVHYWGEFVKLRGY